MSSFIDSRRELIWGLGMALLLVICGIVMFYFGLLLTFAGLDELLDSPEFGRQWPGLELVVVPIAAVAASMLRIGEERASALRGSRVGPFLPLILIMVATVALSFGYLLSDSTWPRWLVAALLTIFTVVWRPIFPRVTATLAGMIAGPAIVAIVGYAFFSSFMASPANPPTAALTAFWVALAILPLWVIVYSKGWPFRGSWGVDVPSGPLANALLSGALMLCLALSGVVSDGWVQ